MTSRTQFVIVAIIALLVGGVGGGLAGGYVAAYFVGGFMSDGMMLGNAVDTQMNVAVLRSIRDGETERATEMLETSLDGNILSLSSSAEYSDRTNEAVAKAIRNARGYRSDHPRKTDLPELDNAVAEILSRTGQ